MRWDLRNLILLRSMRSLPRRLQSATRNSAQQQMWPAFTPAIGREMALLGELRHPRSIPPLDDDDEDIDT